MRLHPGLKDVYRRKVAQLEEALNDDAVKTDAMEFIRGMIDKIVMTPIDDGLNAELYGDLAEILAFCDREGSKRKHLGPSDPGCRLSVVAGARYHLYRTRLEWRGR